MAAVPSLRYTGLPLAQPTPLVDPTRVRANIARMASRARESGVRLRPHFKTHQSAEVGGWFREQGVEAITVSSLRMARYFASHGWRDITVAFPANLREIDTIAALAEEISLGILVDDPSVVRVLADGLSTAVRAWVKIDTGLGRAGARWDDHPRLEAVAEALKPAVRLEYAGVLTHAGHSYAARSRAALLAVHAESVARLWAARDVLAARLGRAGELSIGDTPTCSTVERFEGVDEIRPGNFVFYDLMQLAIGSCREEALAVAITCPVVGKYPRRGEIVIYGGAVHLSKEALVGWPAPEGTMGHRERMVGTGGSASLGAPATIPESTASDRDDPGARRIYGCLATDPGAGLGRPEPRASVTALSQEHGVVRVPPELWDAVDVGDLVLVFPVHACLACDLFDRYVTLDGRRLERMRS